eukprot:Sspe_Gene.75632::Locus_47258_Transcript_1_1_Confidence_1.000_Length_1621::g.75632::m.75632/K13711/PI4K2; phosphatidylinositol 4-kinase type 2
MPTPGVDVARQDKRAMKEALMEVDTELEIVIDDPPDSGEERERSYTKVHHPTPATGSRDHETRRHSWSSLLSMVGSRKRDPYRSHIAEVERIAEEVRMAIAKGIFPELIAEGSSGSYFSRDITGAIVGVFKPKSEEPYSEANPKWGKWFQRNLCPCCFGRSCLVPNTGYLSEASASLLDQHLGLGIVPLTGVVELAAPSLHYTKWLRTKAKVSGKPLPPKIGSLQQFKRGYRPASAILSILSDLPEDMVTQFTIQFQYMVILDYIMRNTDRGLANWLVYINHDDIGELPLENAQSRKQAELRDSLLPVPSPSGRNGESAGPMFYPSRSQYRREVKGCVKIAAIDNGLAFPWKHPDEWRSYPYGWASLPSASSPFLDVVAEHLLGILTNREEVESLISDIRSLWRLDQGFQEVLFARQAALMRGQIHNVVEALRSRDTPIQLLNRELILIEHDDDAPHKGIPNAIRRHIIVRAKPCFPCC